MDSMLRVLVVDCARIIGANSTHVPPVGLLLIFFFFYPFFSTQNLLS